MNIAVLGSNCKFSSDLAVQLNQLKKSSLVYRYDLLADFKKSIPLYKSLLNNTKELVNVVDVDFEEPMVLDEPTKKEIKTSALGEYIGDVETSFIGVPKNEEESKKFKVLESIYDMLNADTNGLAPTYGFQCAAKKMKESTKNTELFSSNLLNIINVFSGILTYDTLNVLLTYDPMTLIVKVKNSKGFLPCTVTEEQLNKLIETNPQIIILEVSSLHELLTNNFFVSTFNLKEKKKEREKKEEPKVTPVLETHRIVMMDLVNLAA